MNYVPYTQQMKCDLVLVLMRERDECLNQMQLLANCFDCESDAFYSLWYAEYKALTELIILIESDSQPCQSE